MHGVSAARLARGIINFSQISRESLINDAENFKFFSSFCLARSSLLARERPQGKSVKAGEDAVSGLGLEIQDPAHRPVVLAHRLVQVDPRHLALGEVDGPEVRDPALLVAVHPDLLADHQHVRVLVEHNLGGALPPQPGLRHPPPL